ncbi:hypothetical protein BDV39DRAFT_127212 [Aspergillus sergii]|uniref:Uncharacterized protein n=1 Tax=Aspergillus sergii TaxID=1034303 RepID=A0A5N6WT71_9EURO|nr:hypothetical protein BDV39DRAFT_127212 [Aspergillus sergii]
MTISRVYVYPAAVHDTLVCTSTDQDDDKSLGLYVYYFMTSGSPKRDWSVCCRHPCRPQRRVIEHDFGILAVLAFAFLVITIQLLAHGYLVFVS